MLNRVSFTQPNSNFEVYAKHYAAQKNITVNEAKAEISSIKEKFSQNQNNDIINSLTSKTDTFEFSTPEEKEKNIASGATEVPKLGDVLEKIFDFLANIPAEDKKNKNPFA